MYVAIRDPILKQTEVGTSQEALQELGINAVEIAVTENMETFHFLKSDGAKYNLGRENDLKELEERLRKENIRISAFLRGNDFLNKFDQEVEGTIVVVKAAERLGVSAVRVDMNPKGKPGVDLKEFAELCSTAASKILAETKNSEVALAVENHGKISNQPKFLDAVFTAVDSNRMGLTLDTGNFYWFGHPIENVYEIFERYADRVRHTHVKNIRYPEDQRSVQRKMGWEYKERACPIYEGDIDHKRVVSMLRKAGYTGSLTLENECIGRFPQSERLDIFKKEIDHLKGCLE